ISSCRERPAVSDSENPGGVVHHAYTRIGICWGDGGGTNNSSPSLRVSWMEVLSSRRCKSDRAAHALHGCLIRGLTKNPGSRRYKTGVVACRRSVCGNARKV